MICPFCESEIEDGVCECPECGSKITVGLQDSNKNNSDILKKEMQEEIDAIKKKESKKKKIKWSIILIIFGMIVSMYAYTKYVSYSTKKTIENSCPDDYPNDTYYEVFNKVFDQCNWEMFSVEKYIFTGMSAYNGLEAEFEIDFDLMKDDGKEVFVPTNITMNAWDLSDEVILKEQSDINKAIDYIFANQNDSEFDWWDFFPHDDYNNIDEEYGEDETESNNVVGDEEDTEDISDDINSMEFVYYDGLSNYSLVLQYNTATEGYYSLRLSDYDEGSDEYLDTYSNGTFEENSNFEGVLTDTDHGTEWDYYISYKNDHYELYLSSEGGAEIILYDKEWADENAG